MTSLDQDADGPQLRPGSGYLLVCALCSAALFVLWSLTHLTLMGQRLDGDPLPLVVRLHQAWADEAELLRMVLPAGSAALALALSVPLLRGGRWHRVALAFMVPVVAGSLAELLKVALRRPDLGVPGYVGNSFPSSNAAVVVGLWVTVWLVLPTACRPWAAAVGAVVSGLAMLASVTTYAHRWSDVLGSVLLVAAVTTLLTAANTRSGS